MSRAAPGRLWLGPRRLATAWAPTAPRLRSIRARGTLGGFQLQVSPSTLLPPDRRTQLPALSDAASASPGARGTLSAPRGGARSSAGPLEKSRVPRGATGPRRFSTRASSTHPKHTKVPGPGRLGAPPSCVELGEPLDCSHFPGDPRPQKPRRSDPGCAPRGAPGHRTPGLGGSGRGCRRPELGIKRGTYLATG